MAPSPPDVRSPSPDDAWFAAIHNAQESERSKSPNYVDLLPEFEPEEDYYIPLEVGVEWATSWLRGWGAVERKPRAPYDMAVPLPRRATPRSATLGWLLAGNREKTLKVIRTTFHDQLSPPPALIEHFKGIMDKAWPKLESHQTYQEAHSLHEKLLNQVSKVEQKFDDKLKDIQTTYEGGQPLL